MKSRNFKKFVFLTPFVAALSACVSPGDIQQSIEKFNSTIPECYSADDCRSKWLAAKRWIDKNTGYKLQIYTDDHIETYNSTRYDPKLAARVIKEPLLDGSGYKIIVSVWCGNSLGCNPDAWAAGLDFNEVVSTTKPLPKF